MGTTDWWTVLRSKWRCFAGGFLPRWPCVLGLLCYSLIWYSCLWPDLDHICKFQFLSWKKDGIFAPNPVSFEHGIVPTQNQHRGIRKKETLEKSPTWLPRKIPWLFDRKIYSPEKLTCPLENSVWKSTFLLTWPLFRCIFKLQPLNSPIRAIDHVIQLMYQKQFFVIWHSNGVQKYHIMWM